MHPQVGDPGGFGRGEHAGHTGDVHLDGEQVVRGVRHGIRKGGGSMTGAALEDERRWEEIEAAVGGLSVGEHAWDEAPAGWVRAQRRGDARRVG